jgi:4-amino-4-deoxy-L-arabinose transferase-like glycosyltransferase
MWFFIPVLIGGALPWTAFFPWILRTAWTRFRERASQPLAPWQGMLLGWTVIPFVVLSLSGSKLLTYVLPLYPALALAVAVAWDRHVSRQTTAGRWAWRVAALVLVVFTSALVGVRFTRFGGSAPVWPLVMVAALVVVTLLKRWNADSGTDLPRLAIAASAVWIALVLQVPALNGILGRQASVRELAAMARDYSGPDGAVFSYDVRACGFGFYLDRVIGIRASEADLVLKPTPEESKRLIDSASAAAQLAGPGRRVCGITTREHWGTEFTKPEWEELGRAGAFVLIGRQNPAVAR